MARKKSEEPKQDKVSTGQASGIYPLGAFFSVIQLPNDLMPKPPAQRILQMVHSQEHGLKCYISENAYQRSELIDHYDRLMRQSYMGSVSKGTSQLAPLRGKIHWCEFTVEFCEKLSGPRIDPATNAPEVE